MPAEPTERSEQVQLPPVISRRHLHKRAGSGAGTCSSPRFSWERTPGALGARGRLGPQGVPGPRGARARLAYPVAGRAVRADLFQ